MTIADFIKPHPVQAKAFQYIGQGKIIFYGGARGGGKSWLALAAAMSISLKYPKIVTTIYRKTYGELHDVFLSKQQILFPPKVFGYKYREKLKESIFDNGSKIIFRAIDSVKDTEKSQGAETQFLVIDEAPNFSVEVIRILMATCRNSTIKNFKETILLTGNPGGISDSWFRSHFVNIDFSQWTPQERKNFDKFVFIPAKVWDNPYIDVDEYVAKLSMQGEAKRRAWLNGEWDAFEGQFFDMWNPSVHVIEPFEIPSHWHKAIGFDLGYTETHPSVAEFVAQNPDTGELFVFDEYVNYGVVEQYVTDMVEMYRQCPGAIIYGDPSMFDKTKRNSYLDESPAQLFLKSGLPIVPANNDRINGWRMLKQWLFHTPTRKPKLFVFNKCRYLIQTLPTLQYTPYARTDIRREDVDTRAADDAADALRYVVMSAFGYPVVNGLEYVHIDEQEKLKKEYEALNKKIDYEEDKQIFNKLRTYHAVY